ncbi:DUF4145 domain-containing protein [Pseudarthrobacter sp. NamE5]|nr:DUF4145 domain-containing protein [Pseudarthrobacter sp. NamE5]
MSAILMARSVIEAVAKDHEITSGSLFKKIDAMHEKGLISAFAQKTAHAIRTFGNYWRRFEDRQGSDRRVQTAFGQLRNKLFHNCQAPADTSSATRTAVRFESKTCRWTCAETGVRTLF